MMDFYIPSGIQTDFEDMINTPGFGTAVTINPTSATPVQTTVQLSNPNFKSNYQNLSDNARILRSKLTDTIIKGDYLTTEDGVNYIVTWSLYRDVNSYKGQCQLCNSKLTFTRWTDAVLDDYGTQATPAQYTNIAEDILVFTSRTSTGIFDSGTSQVGIVPQGQMLIGLQYNSETALIQIGDEFSFKNNIQYEVIDIDYSQLNDADETGILLLFTKKRAGGIRTST
jgi:hypothetical protein